MHTDNKKAIDSDIFVHHQISPVLTSTLPGYGQIVLNRPKKLNPIIYEITQNVIPFLERCTSDDNIKFIILKGAGRAFCAGGDLYEILEGVTADIKYASNLYIGVYDYYRCLYKMATMRKPIITMMDGLTVGGGSGYAQISAFKIATENTILSLPEALIGHFIDAGNSFTYSRLDNQLGAYLILTGHSLYAEDIMLAGLATHFVRSENLEALQSALGGIIDCVSLDTIDATIQKFAVKQDHVAKHYTLHGAKLKTISECFKYDSVEEIVRALKKKNTKFAQQSLDSIDKNCPFSMKLSLMLLRQAAHQSFAKCVDYEYYYWRNLQFRQDYIEGMTAVKEKRRPSWNPARLEEVDLQAEIAKNNCLALAAYPRHNPQLDFTTSPYKKYVLPTAEDVKIVSEKYGLLSNKDVLNWFMESDQGQKFGLRQRLQNILDSKVKHDQTDDFFAKL